MWYITRQPKALNFDCRANRSFVTSYSTADISCETCTVQLLLSILLKSFDIGKENLCETLATLEIITFNVPVSFG